MSETKHKPRTPDCPICGSAPLRLHAPGCPNAEAAGCAGDEPGKRIAVFPRMPAKQFAPGKCVMCGAKGDTPVTPIRFGDFGTGTVVPMCARCLALAADTLAAALEETEGKAQP